MTTAQTLKWGILGPGSISTKFATGLQSASNGRLVAVGSRNKERAEAFAQQFGATNVHDSYEALAADPDIDAIYIGSPHTFHKDHAIMCMRAGKHVLCEKPFAVNANDAAEMIAVAQETGLFLMEAMWTRYLPVHEKIRELIAAGVIGDVRKLFADFGFRMGTVLPDHRLFNPALGGGALLDVGIYPLSLASNLFGTPNRIASLANLGSTGVDEENAFILGYENGEMALCSSDIQAHTPWEATIIGTAGSIKIHTPWFCPNQFTLKIDNTETLYTLDYKGNGYTHEAEEVANCIAEGKTESAGMPLVETLTIMQTMDQLRAQWGLKYPME